MSINVCCLPKKGPWEDLKKIGFKIIADNRDLFYETIMPKGWVKDLPFDMYYSHLKDDNGKIRALIFCKFSFYDSSAWISLIRRYNLVQNYSLVDYDRNKYEIEYSITDCGEKIHTFESTKFKTQEDMWASEDSVKKECIKYFDEKYPNNKDFLAYWD